jgi:hypothetical protein
VFAVIWLDATLRFPADPLNEYLPSSGFALSLLVAVEPLAL